jgi:hypothetical protein
MNTSYIKFSLEPPLLGLCLNCLKNVSKLGAVLEKRKGRKGKWKSEKYQMGIKGTQMERKFLFRVRFL